MASFEPTIVLFGPSKSIASANIRLPVSVVFAFDVESLEQLVTVPTEVTDTWLSRFFIILFVTIDKELLIRLRKNHRVQAIYQQNYINSASPEQIIQMRHVLRQFTLDLSNDIIHFLTSEGTKQIQLEQISLVKIYYQQARALKQWMMSFFKAEPCHILIVSLNSSDENLNSTHRRLKNICTKIGFNSAVIRQFNDYIPNSERNSLLLPYAELLFNNEDPCYICRLIKKLSPIRLYLYGNKLCNLSEWSKLMISTEQKIMDDEDDWSAFIENECVEDEIKWNFGFIFGREWQVSRISPINLNQLDQSLRFRSALRRAHATFAQRQVEVTANIFDWYTNCIEKGYLQEEPKLTDEKKTIKYNQDWDQCDIESPGRRLLRNLRSFDYSRFNLPNDKLLSFVWLDEILDDCDIQLQQIIEPFQWQFFDNVSSCVSQLEMQLREQRSIFLITSGALGKQLFLSGLCLMNQIFATYIYCAHLGPNLEWSRDYSNIRGIYNDSVKLANQIQEDYNKFSSSFDLYKTQWYTISKIIDENQISLNVEDTNSLLPLPLMVYDSNQAQLFMAHQRTIDTLLCMPHTTESKIEMLTEFRHMYHDNTEILAQIDNFEKAYHPNAAVRCYTRDYFVWRTIHYALRSSNVAVMFKIRYILTDIYVHLQESYYQMHYSASLPVPEIFYRGQLMSWEEFNHFKALRGSIISINTFLSTTASMQVALIYASKNHENLDLVSVIFSIETNEEVPVRPYANISHYSLFQDEEETLFAMGSVFYVGNIRQMIDADNVWIIHLKTINRNDYRFK